MNTFKRLTDGLLKDVHELRELKSTMDEESMKKAELILNPKIEDSTLRERIAKLREKLGDKVLERHSDYDLRRFLKARHLKVDKAVTMYEEMLKIRTRFGLDKPDFFEAHQPMDAFANHYPIGLCGHDKDGYPIAYEFPGLIDVKGFDSSMTNEEFVTQVLWNLESLLCSMELRSIREGRLCDRWSFIVDMRGLSVMESFSKNHIKRTSEIQRILDACYAERGGRVLILNVSAVYDILYNIFKPFLAHETKAKILLLKSESELLNYIDADQLPVVYGGTKVDSNGDPECSEWITRGSIVDKSLYKL